MEPKTREVTKEQLDGWYAPSLPNHQNFIEDNDFVFDNGSRHEILEEEYTNDPDENEFE